MWTSADDNAQKAFNEGMRVQGDNLMQVLDVMVRDAPALQIMSLIEIVKPWCERQLKIHPELKYHDAIAPFVEDDD